MGLSIRFISSALAWWNEAKKAGEEVHLTNNVLGDKDAEWPSDALLEIIGHKYPKQLPKIYRQMLEERPKMYGSSVADAVATSSLSLEQKRELFQLGATSSNATHRRDAVRCLQELKSK